MRFYVRQETATSTEGKAKSAGASPFRAVLACRHLLQQTQNERLTDVYSTNPPPVRECGIMTGWIRLHRGWRESDVFTGEPASEREAWIHLIEMAAWKPMLRRAGKGDVINVDRGQLHTAERTLADMWFWDRKRVRRFLNRLEKYQMITQETGPSGSLITICNYGEYQSCGTDDGAIHGTNRGPIEDQSRTTQEEGKEFKEGKEGKEGKGWVLPEWVDAEAWADWEQHRKALKKPMTDKARTLAVGVLKKAVEAGFTCRETVDLAITSGWQGLFVPKGRPSSGPMAGMSFAEARDKIAELQYRRDMLRLQLEDNREECIDKYRAVVAELEALERAVGPKPSWMKGK